MKKSMTAMILAAVTVLVIGLHWKYGYGEDAGKPEMKVQMGHNYSISSVSFSPNGKYILSGSGDRTVRLWDLSNRKLLRIFNGHSEYVTSVAFSPDGKYILSGSSDKTVKLWDIATGEELRTFVGHLTYVTSVAFSHDGKYILSGSRDYTIKLWDILNGSEIKTFNGHSGFVNSVAFSSDDRYILTGSSDDTVKLWDVATGKVIKIFTGHLQPVLSVAFSFDGKYVVSGAVDGTIKFWDIEKGNEIWSFTGHTDRVNSVSFSPDDKYVISASKDGLLNLWNTASGKKIRTFSAHLNFDDNAQLDSASFSPDGEIIVIASGIGMILYNTKTAKIIHIFDAKTFITSSAIISPDGLYTAVGSYDGSIILWNNKTAKIEKKFIKHKYYVSSLAFSPNGKLLASGAAGNSIKLWNVASGKEIIDCRNDAGFIKGVSDEFYLPIYSLAFSTDGKYFASSSPDRTIKIWDVGSGKIIKSLPSYNEPCYIAFLSDNKRIIYTSDKTIILDFATGKKITEIEPRYKQIISPDHKYLLYQENNNVCILREISTGKKILRFNKFHTKMRFRAISTDCKFIVYNIYDESKIEIMELQTGKFVRSFKGSSGEEIPFAEFLMNDKYIMFTSTNGTTRIWNIETGQWIAFMSHSNGKDWLIFDSDGYWDASRYGGDLVAMVKGMDCWNIDQFAVKNNRPDLILAKLPNADRNLISEYYKQYKKRIAKLEKLYGIKESDLSSDLHVPKAEILKSGQKGKNLELSIKLTDSRYDIVSYNIYVNDVPVYAEIGKKIKRTKALDLTETIELSSGDNKIEVSCFNEKGAESYRSLTYSTYEGKKKGNLYFIGFGVCDYRDESIKDLKYAENDVLDLAKKFSAMKNDYDNVYIKTYTGKDVTPSNIKSAKDFVKKASVDDTVILFISGHGMHDSDEYKTYYYLTQNTDMKNLKGTAADFETVEDILAGINPRKKLFLMDTCDSGEPDDFAGKSVIASISKGKGKGIPRTPKGLVVEYANSKGYFDKTRFIYNDLFRRTGAIVFSSSKGGEVSWEFDELKNGAFTEAILEGLTGKADADNNGTVSIDELQDYVSKSVGKYTEDKQHPVIDRDNIYVKFGLPVR